MPLALKDFTLDEFRQTQKALEAYRRIYGDPELAGISEALGLVPEKMPVILPKFSEGDLRRLILALEVYHVLEADNITKPWDATLDGIVGKLRKKFVRTYKKEPYSG